MQIPTIEVRRLATGDVCTINESDFDAALHERADTRPEWKEGDPLRTDGPTLEEFVAAGYLAKNYPPQGYTVVAASPVVIVTAPAAPAGPGHGGIGGGGSRRK